MAVLPDNGNPAPLQEHSPMPHVDILNNFAMDLRAICVPEHRAFLEIVKQIYKYGYQAGVKDCSRGDEMDALTKPRPMNRDDGSFRQ